MKKSLLILSLLAALQTATAQTTLSTVSGTWYDPTYNGSGFNMAEFSNGLFAYFYGYKGAENGGANGQAQWLLTASSIPTPIEKGKTYTVNMVSGFVGNGGSFTTKPNTEHSGTTAWGTMNLTFNSCNSGHATLDGKDGKLTHNIIKLAGLSGLTCIEKQTATPPLSPLKKFGIFTVQSDEKTVYMNGAIDENISQSFNQLKAAFPNAKRIVMLDCPGSSDDESNLQVAKQMHDLGYEFHLTTTSVIASGAVDMYVGGVKRTMEKGAKIGVHSWGSEPGEPRATAYPKGHAVHLPYINYYVSVGFTQQQAEDFYYYTINAAPAESIHWMTDAEIKQYHIISQ